MDTDFFYMPNPTEYDIIVNRRAESMTKSHSKTILKSKHKSGERRFSKKFIYAVGGIIVILMVVTCLIVIYYSHS